MAESKSAKSTYHVLSNLLHDKKLYKKGSTVELTPREAAPLLRHKTVEPAK